MNRYNLAEDFSRDVVMAYYKAKQSELERRHRKYKRILTERPKTRKQVIRETSTLSSNKLLRKEKGELKAKIWVANGVLNRRQNERYLREIRCHVRCQEHLEEDINKLKVDIPNIKQEIGRMNKHIYELNKETVTEPQYLAFVAIARKRMNILENKLEVGKRQECAITAVNAELRETLDTLIHQKTWFNKEYTSMVNCLMSDHKYLIELTEYAIDRFDSCIEVYNKMDVIRKRKKKEAESLKLEMQSIMRRTNSEAEQTEFTQTKGQKRTLADLPLKEYKRRERFRKEHIKKIALYNRILRKILEYTDSKTDHVVIQKFKEQESVYYSYYNFSNEMSYHIAMLNKSVNRLYTNIDHLTQSNANTKEAQLDTISNLKKELKNKQNQNSELTNRYVENEERMESLLQGLEAIFEEVNADAKPLQSLLGDHKHVDLVNVTRFCQILERRLVDIVACVYITEREKEQTAKSPFVVQDIEKVHETPTELDNIVMAQQCPECAEGDAYNAEEAGDAGPRVLSVEEAKKNLYEKVAQPEMQYRLHSLSHCRLPRSRQIAAKRNP